MGISWHDLSPYQRSLLEGAETPEPPRARILRRPRAERDEQRLFANWCLLNALPFCWHATHKRSTATVGVFDFWIGKNGKSMWLEFKQLPGRLSKEQIAFSEALSMHKIKWHIVHSADEAIAIIKSV